MSSSFFDRATSKPQFEPKPVGRLDKLVRINQSIPDANNCIYLGPGSSVRTQLDFGSFVTDDHTLAAWFMPQYVNGDYGALFANSGPGLYLVGQGNYREGTFVLDTRTKGDPVLAIVIGSQKVIYLEPDWRAGRWQHLAVVRRGNGMELFLNGTRRTPVVVSVSTNSSGDPVRTASPGPELVLSQLAGAVPKGTLVLGCGKRPDNPGAFCAQAYGLLDDVAVFGRALSAGEIAGLVEAKRVSGHEPGLIAGWGFDSPLAPSLLPPALASPTQETHVVEEVKVSSHRDNTRDAELLDNPWVYAVVTPSVRLPFRKGEIWAVSQGSNSADWSHSGSAAFCYDLELIEADTDAATGPKDRYPFATGRAPVFASLGGEVMSYVRADPNADVGKPSEREPNIVNVVAPEVVVSYLHLEADSLHDRVTGGEHTSSGMVTPWPSTRRPIEQGDVVGKIGPFGRHLHLACGPLVMTPEFLFGTTIGTIPFGFDDIEVRRAGSDVWEEADPVFIPKTGDHLRSLWSRSRD